MPFDVLIAGGGIAGPCLAFWLTRRSHSVTIIEQARQLRTGGQAVDFRGASLVVLEKMGLLPQVRASATRMGPLVLVDERGREIGRLPTEVISGELEIYWGDLARILYEAVRDSADYRFGVRVTSLDDDGDRVNVTFSDASTGSYDVVIGADGLHSGVRGMVFGPEEQYVTQLGQCFGFFDIENRLRIDHCGMACAARPTTQRRYRAAAHTRCQQARRPAVADCRTLLHVAELLSRYTVAAPWRPAPPAKRPAPSIASAATREMLANS